MTNDKETRQSRWRRLVLWIALVTLCLGAFLAPIRERLEHSWAGRALTLVCAPMILAAEGVYNVAAVLGGSARESDARKTRLADLEKKNLALHLENESLLQSNAALRKLALAERVYSNAAPELIPGRIVSFSTRWYARSCVVDIGSGEGVEDGMMALTLDGVAGVVRRTGGGVSAVQLITDRTFRVGARLEGDETVGLLRGLGEPDEMLFDPGGRTIELKEGARIVTAGTEGSLFPENLTLGYVQSVEQNKAGMFIAHIRPAADPEREHRLFIAKPSGKVNVDKSELTR
jgi:rod shape-determining protein MreC